MQSFERNVVLLRFGALIAILLCGPVSCFITSRSASYYTTLTFRPRDLPHHANTLRSFKLLSTTKDSPVTSDSSTTGNEEQQRTTCKHCSQVLPTRNALFRHIRTDPTCSLKENPDNIEMVKESIAFLFGYIDASDDNDFGQPNAETAGSLLQATIHASLKDVTKATFNMTSKLEVEFIGVTQASVAKQRHRTLSQESGCSAAGDVLVASVTVPKVMKLEVWTRVFETIRERLKKDRIVEAFSCQLLGSDSRLHAERSCTQRVYHYLLPLSWLPNAIELKEWWQSEEIVRTDQRLKKLAPPPSSLRRFKDALRSAECTKIPAEEIRLDVNRTLKVAKGRFGALGTRERRPWHNFADPNLRGDASPSNEPVWRAVDRTRIVDFLEDENGEVMGVVEIKGDEFVNQQARRIIGTALAITHGWLPHDFFQLSTSVETVIETPLAPPGRLYLAGVRFHFEELQTKGLPFFEKDETRTVVDFAGPKDNYRWAQAELLGLKSTISSAAEEEEWLRDLETAIAPRIRDQLRLKEDFLESATSVTKSSQCPDSYQIVLAELRRIVASDQWPDTSVARSKVIQQDERKESNRHGSFTIVNPGVEANWDTLPLGNSLFPELVKAVFELEMRLAEDTVDRVTVEGLEQQLQVERPPSSHCAVNCNAQFTPHVDSGRGAGQSLSMIVGFGDYAGGELFVEGPPFDIRYKPIEFDGWKLRHWTNRFCGERFSLVWFTPETKG
jgi:tRNA U38,U39,U40 pseudouridine synthase TruA